jgi:hypothetical protein
MPAKDAVSIASRLLSDPNVNPAGLGARDSLRLEAGLCLYGHDLDGSINPIEAGLAWTMGGPKSRRRTEGGFLGADRILKSDGGLMKVDKKRVGIMMGVKAPAREGAEIYDAVGDKLIGKVTSGTFSPCLKGESDPVRTSTTMVYHRRPFADSRMSAHYVLIRAVASRFPPRSSDRHGLRGNAHVEEGDGNQHQDTREDAKGGNHIDALCGESLLPRARISRWLSSNLVNFTRYAKIQPSSVINMGWSSCP